MFLCFRCSVGTGSSCWTNHSEGETSELKNTQTNKLNAMKLKLLCCDETLVHVVRSSCLVKSEETKTTLWKVQ